MKENSVIEVNKKEYTVISIVEFDNDKYVYLVNVDNYNDAIFAKIRNHEIEVIKDKKILKELIKLFNLKINEKKLMESY